MPPLLSGDVQGQRSYLHSWWSSVDLKTDVIFASGRIRYLHYCSYLKNDGNNKLIQVAKRWSHVTPSITQHIESISILINPSHHPLIRDEQESSDFKAQIILFDTSHTSSSAGGHLTQEEAAKEALAIRISRKLEGQINENAFADTGSDINTMPYQIYEQLGREEMKKVDRRITMINHTQAEAIGILTNVLCQVRVTTLIAKFLILDIPIDRDSPIPIDRDSPIVVGRGFLHVMRNAESDSDDKEEYHIKRNKFGAPIYGPKPAPYLNCNDPAERSLAIQTVTNPFRKISVWKKVVSFLGSLPVPSKHVNWKPDYKGSYTKQEEATGQ
ncbi:agenet domain-containing protein [Tanacetum coccineum]